MTSASGPLALAKDTFKGNRTIGRLAPSPTGAQHIGNARTYLIAWLAARAHGGRVVLRIEDIDSPRIKPGAAELVCADLLWLGLDWDTGPIVQSERIECYESALLRLQERELVYPCTCTRSDIARSASAPHADHREVAYPGTCSWRRAGDHALLGDRPCAWRFRVPAQSPTLVDGFRGLTEIDLRKQGGDFVVWKSAGTPAYQLAVVVDDAAAEVTEVVRADDLLCSTPRQLLLYEALGLPPPRFVHVPLVVGPDGRRLAKRHGDTRLETVRAAGIQPEALIGLLAWSCGWIARPEPVAARDLIVLYRLDAIPPAPFVLEPQLLRSMGLAD